MKLKLIAIDMDDTILNKDLEISEKNKSAIWKAEENGAMIVLASGRSPFGLKKYMKELKMDEKPGYAICYNGALIIKTDTMEEVVSEKLNLNVATEVSEYVETRGYDDQFYKDDTIFVSSDNEYTNLDCKLTGMKKQVVHNIYKYLMEDTVKLIIPGEPGKLLLLQDKLREKFGDKTNIFTSKPYFLEVMSKGADKGLALSKLADIMKISRDEVMAIGDAMNDEGMIRFAGKGAVMCNGVKQLKNIADIISQNDNNHSGVAEIIEKAINDSF